MPNEQDVEKKIHATFAGVASALGYSEVHGRIISVLLADGTLSLQEIAKKTGYSLSSISISLDLLEIVGIVRKFRKSGERKLYVKLEGDLLEGLRNALLFKLKKEIASTLEDFDEFRSVENKKAKKMISTLGREMQRLDEYVKRLSEVEIPEK